MTPSTVACAVAISFPISISSCFADLPERVLADDRVVVSEGPKIAAADFDSLALDRRPGDRPLRDAAGAGDEMIVVAVVDIGDPLEARRESAAHLVLTHEATSARLGPTRGLEHAV